jgi:hypothetical protein
MPRPPKPYVFREWFCTNFGGVAKQKLCRVEEGYKAAELALARLVVQRADAEQEGTAGVPGRGVQADLPPVLPTCGAGLGGPKARLVGEVFDEFLDVKKVETEELRGSCPHAGRGLRHSPAGRRRSRAGGTGRAEWGRPRP